MVLPTPVVPLDDICSVIYNNTLYAYSSKAFQSLELSEGAQWEELPPGVAVTGGVCVGSTPKDASQAGFYVVGGTSSNSSFQGLQKFTYATGEWESIELSAPVTQQRLWHGATYINQTDSLVIYGGNQDGSQHPSSQTFTIDASEPHTILAWESTAPPTISPILLPWSETHAVMLGGSSDNTRVMLFSSSTGWVDSGATLQIPITNGMAAALAPGDDGCMNLYTFDMTTSPNSVNRTVLMDGNGAPVTNSPPITARSFSGSMFDGMEKRDLRLSDWPAYNSSLAPTSTRTSYSIAQDTDGLVVLAGGSSDDVLCMFQSRENQWKNASLVLSGAEVTIESLPSSSANAAATATNTATQGTQTSTEAAAGGSGNVNPNKLLGAVLGSVLGAAVILIIALCLLRRRKRKLNYMEAGHARRASGVSSVEKEDRAFATNYRIPSEGAGTFRGHQPQNSQSSFSSMAILMGKVNKQSSGRSGSKGSNRLSATDALKGTIGKPVLQENDSGFMTREEKGVSFAPDVAEPQPRPRGNGPEPPPGARRSSGWNRYWSGGSALNILGYGASKRTTVESASSSRYSDPHRITQDSATVPALRIEHEKVPPIGLQRVNSGSPTIAQYPGNIPLQEASVGQIERPISRGSSTYSSGIPPSVQESWDPIAAKKPWGADRAASSIYSQPSLYPTALGIQSHRNEPMPPKPTLSVSQQPPLAMASMSSDMSWLNLGEQSRRER